LLDSLLQEMILFKALTLFCIRVDLILPASVDVPDPYAADADKDNMDYLANRLSIKDELMLEDEQLALAHIDMDIKDFEELEATIRDLHLQIQMHSDEHLVDQKELVHADKELDDRERSEIHPTLWRLKSLKAQIIALKHKFNNTTISEINAIVESAESFLQKNIGFVHDYQVQEKNWSAEEEEKKIKMAFNSKTNFSLPVVQKIYYNNKSSEIKYPVKMSEGLKASLENAKVIIQKIKEEKLSRAVPQNLENTNYGEMAKEIDTQVFLKQLKKKLDEEEDVRRKQKEETINQHKFNEETLEAFEKAKDEAKEFIESGFHANPASQPVPAHDRYIDYIFMGLIVLGCIAILFFLKPVRRIWSGRLDRRRARLAESDLELNSVAGDCNGLDAGRWQRWSPWSNQKRYQHKLK